jgi:uncharacterized protein YjbJ (UPF0337 family)
MVRAPVVDSGRGMHVPAARRSETAFADAAFRASRRDNRTPRKEPVVDTDRVEGKVTETEGEVQEKWGDVTGDDTDRAEGKSKQAEGEVEQKWGEAKDKARDAWDDVKDKVEDVTDGGEDRVDERDDSTATR